MKKISIVVPIYNVKNEYLELCIKSLINQTLRDIEIILVDDGSCEECAKLCDMYADLDSRIVVVHKNNEGVSIARNFGIEKSDSKWIMFVDGDDWIEKNACEDLYNIAENEDIETLIFNAYINFPNKREKNTFYKGECSFLDKNDIDDIELQIINRYSAKHQPQFNVVGIVWGKLYKSSFLKENAIFFKKELSRAEDHIFTLTAINKSKKVLYINKYLYNYRRSENSAVNRYTKNISNSLNNTLEEFLRFISQNNKNTIYMDAYFARVVTYIFTSLKNDYTHLNNTKKYKVRIEELKKLLNENPYKEAMENVKMKDLKIVHIILLFFIKKRILNFIFFISMLRNFWMKRRIYK